MATEFKFNPEFKMSRPLLRQKGIILRTLPYQERHLILTVLTEETGLAGFIAGRKQAPAANPLTEAEFVYTPGQSSLLRCKEVTPLDQNRRLREDFERLQAACAMAGALLQTQMENRPSPALYALLRRYLQKLPEPSPPKTLLASFKLKLLKHEGLLNTDSLPEELSFSEEELLQLQILADGRSFKDFALVEMDRPFEEKLERLFRSTTGT